MSIIRGTTPTIRVRFSKIEIPDLSTVKAFYFAFTQKGVRLGEPFDRMIYKDYETIKATLSDAPSSTDTYTFDFKSNGEKFGLIETTGDEILFDTTVVFENGAWVDAGYSTIYVDNDALDDFNSAYEQGLNDFSYKTSIYDFDPQNVTKTVDECYVETTLTQTQTNGLIADVELYGTCDVVYEEVIQGSLEHKRGTSKRFSEMVCNAERSGELLTGEPSS